MQMLINLSFKQITYYLKQYSLNKIVEYVNHYSYLDDTLTKLANMTINQDSDIPSLLPWNYKE
jgi:hypothetical protein